MNKERLEALIRIPVGIVSWIIVELWGILATILVVLSFIYTIFTGKRHKGMADFVNKFVSYMYSTLRYISFTTNQRPFPFNKLEKPIEKVDMKSTQK